jgi:adenylate cyclase
MALRNAAVTEDRRIVYRIGINIGDIIVEDEDIYGDGVNIAARLEELAQPGGICVARNVYNQVRDKLDLGFEDLGEVKVKNIARPIRIISVKLSAVVRPTQGNQKDSLSSSLSSDKPSIAILPFTNMSGDPEQAYFSDGITEDIITELSRFRNLFVVARNSSFAYKNRDTKIHEIAQELGVKYVLEGSIRKAGNRVRINAQLVEASTGNHLWAERYDRELGDIFAVQDELTRTIVATLVGRLDKAGVARAIRKQTDILTAYDYVLRGNELSNRNTREDNVVAKQLYQTAVQLDPQYARAYARLANNFVDDVLQGWSTKEALGDALEIAYKAVDLDDQDSWAQASVGMILFLMRHHDDAEVHLQSAVRLNPNDVDIAAYMAILLVYLGKPEESLQWINSARRLNPLHPEWYHSVTGIISYSARRYSEAIEAFRKCSYKDRVHHAYLAASYAQVGQMEEARVEAELFLTIRTREVRETGEQIPDSPLELASFETDLFRSSADKNHFLEGLRKAGVQE